MIVLPSSIESYLKEAGFSVTEIIILQKLLIDDALTLRELAAKTGKSTGVLDQAVKKLIGKKIISREVINDQPKYTLMSLQPIQDWMQKDMKQKHEMLERRHSNFESFVATLQMDKQRPEMQYFEGWDGLKKAYALLLEPQEEMLEYDPIPYKAEDDPLRDFKVEYFRERRRRRIYSRIVGPDTPLGRRYQSRDPFEYRRTMLIPEGDFGVHFHKVIVNGIVACIDYSTQRACFIRYPEFAKSERMVFDKLWNQLERQEAPSTTEQSKPEAPVVTVVPLKTRFLSQLREFFLNRASIPSFLIFAILAGAITFGFYRYTENLNLQRAKDKVISIALTGALQFDADDVNAIRTVEDVTKPQYAKLVETLNLIRDNNTDIQYAYIMRKTDNPDEMAFVADADSLDPKANKDLNNDGVINDADATSNPGELYADDEFPLIRTALEKPFAGIGTDQWGTFMTGHAPIRDGSGEAVAVLGIDMFIGKVDALSNKAAIPIYFIVLFAIFVAMRFAARNKSLFREAIKLVQVRNIIVSLLICSTLALGITCGVYFHTLSLLRAQMTEKLMAIASTAASQFNNKDLEQLHFARDMKKESYQRVFQKLNEIRDQNEGIMYAYIFRRTEDPEIFEFVADADSNYNLPFTQDDNLDGVLDEADESAPPGVRYFADAEFISRFDETYADESTETDQWGTYLAGSAPINNESGEVVAKLEIAMNMGHFFSELHSKFIGRIWFIFLLSIILISLIFLNFALFKSPKKA